MSDAADPATVAARAPWRFTAVTLFPEMFPGPLGHSLAGRALRDGRWSVDCVDPRDHAPGRHRSVDDAPFGGGAGMVMRPDVVDAACAAARPDGDPRPLLFMTPRGRPLDQALVRRLAAGPGAVALCGRYEGVDQRVVEARGMLEVSAGDYVLSGGELAALLLLDACVRLLPGVMGAAGSGEEESFELGEPDGAGPLLEYPHYTRPAEWQGRAVPAVLLGGNHGAVARWRREQAEAVTCERRPDLWARRGAALAGRERDAAASAGARTERDAPASAGARNEHDASVPAGARRERDAAAPAGARTEHDAAAPGGGRLDSARPAA